MTVGGFVLTVSWLGLAGAVGCWMLTSMFFAAVVAGLLARRVPLLYVRRKRTVRLQTFEEQFPEAIDLISRALRAGHALTTGLGMVADEIPAPVGPEFRRLYDEQNFGMSLPEAMRAMARRVPVLDARFFVTAVLTQREAGGNLSEVLDNLASVMRERFKLKRQIRVISAHGRISAWVLSLLPPVLAAFCSCCRQLHARPVGRPARRAHGACRRDAADHRDDHHFPHGQDRVPPWTSNCCFPSSSSSCQSAPPWRRRPGC